MATENAADAAIKAWVTIYATYGMGVSLIMLMRSLAVRWKMPVTGNVAAVLLFSVLLSILFSDGAAYVIWLHIGAVKIAALFGPMALVSLWGYFYCARVAIRLLPKKPD